MTYACTSSSDPTNISCSDLNVDSEFGDLVGTDGQIDFTSTNADYTGTAYPPGTYTFTITATVTDSSPAVTADFTVTLTVTDPCDPPTSITAPVPGAVDQSYTLSDPAATYTVPEFDIVPSICPIVYSFTIDSLPSGGNPVVETGNERELSVFWDTDLEPIGKTITATVTATSSSLFTPLSNTPATATDSLDYTFVNPCITEGKVTITPQAQTNPGFNRFDGNVVSFTRTDFTVNPTYCTLTYTPLPFEYTGPYSVAAGILQPQNFDANG